MPSLIGGAHAKSDPCYYSHFTFVSQIYPWIYTLLYVSLYPHVTTLGSLYWIHPDDWQDGCRSSHIDGLVQERRNSSALAMELRLSCTNPSKYRV